MSVPTDKRHASLADRLDWSIVACLNLGIDRAGLAGGAHWIYFPDADAPFYSWTTTRLARTVSSTESR